jgi:hypothetical protein
VHGWWDARTDGLVCPDCKTQILLQMERLTVTKINDLQIGDRFYKASDRKKVTMVKVDHTVKRTYYRTYRNFCIEAAVYDHHKGILKAVHERIIRPLNADTAVVFLRHETGTMPSDELTGII